MSGTEETGLLLESGTTRCIIESLEMRRQKSAQLRLFSPAGGVYHLDGGILFDSIRLISSHHCVQVMSYSGSKSRDWARQPTYKMHWSPPG